MKIALVGNPNSGKTTVFNELTGSSQHVGNWPGVTVEKKEGRVKYFENISVVDLPGIYSLSPHTLEEVIARNYLTNDSPDVILNILDVSNLERNLYLTTQLLELDVPVVVFLNMMDIVNSNGCEINSKLLSKKLGCPIIEGCASKGNGLKEAIQQTKIISEKHSKVHNKVFAKTVEKAVEDITTCFSTEVKRWQAIKLLERDGEFIKKLQLSADILGKIETIIFQLERKMDNDSESIIIEERYHYIQELCKECVNISKIKRKNVTHKIDRIVTNKWLAIPIFFMIMWGIYYVSIQTVGSMTVDWVTYIFEDVIMGNLDLFLGNLGVSDWFKGLILDGIVGGVGSVLTFIPQISILFFFLSILEDCGYMARVAFIMDRLFRKFGLSGKSFLPMIIGSGCSVPAIMSSRTIENERDRRMTIILTPFIPCSAKLPVFSLFVAAFFPNDSWVGVSMYLVGIFMVIVSGILLKKSKVFSGKVSPFIMELPSYRIPTLKSIFISMWERIKTFIIKAGTTIYAVSTIVWMLQSFNWRFQMVESSDSILADIGHVIAPIFAPLGFGNWQAAVATVTGFLAKENVVATLGILLGVSDIAGENSSLVQQLGGMFTPVSAYAFMVFILLAAPCFAAIGAIKHEMGNWKWTFIAIGYQTGIAYLMALLVYQIGSIFFIL